MPKKTTLNFQNFHRNFVHLFILKHRTLNKESRTLKVKFKH